MRITALAWALASFIISLLLAIISVMALLILGAPIPKVFCVGALTSGPRLLQEHQQRGLAFRQPSFHDAPTD
jgi:hypothetical protein